MEKERKRQEKWFDATEYYKASKADVTIQISKQLISRNQPLSQHPEVELLYILSGKGRIFINGHFYSLQPHMYLNLNPYHFYSIEVEEPIELYSCSMPLSVSIVRYQSWEMNQTMADFLYEGKPVVVGKEELETEVLPLFQRMLIEQEQKRPFYESQVLNMATQAMAYFMRYGIETSVERQEEGNVVWRAIQKIMLTTHQELTLEQLALEMGRSREQLNQEIRLATGYRFTQLLHLSKMINACALLRFPDLSVEYISNLLCYRSLNTFYDKFKKYAGVTPEEYRQSVNQGHHKIRGSHYDITLQVLVYIHTHYQEKIVADVVAKEMGISESLLQKMMKNNMGFTLHGLIAKIRIQYAAIMLEATKLPACDIAIMVGFDSISTFNRSFKEQMGETPSDYRK